MMDKKIIIALLAVVILLAGCQYKEISDEDIKISNSVEQKSDEVNIDEELEKELEDNLDEALNELEEIEKI